MLWSAEFMGQCSVSKRPLHAISATISSLTACNYLNLYCSTIFSFSLADTENLESLLCHMGIETRLNPYQCWFFTFEEPVHCYFLITKNDYSCTFPIGFICNNFLIPCTVTVLLWQTGDWWLFLKHHVLFSNDIYWTILKETISFKFCISGNKNFAVWDF